MVSALVSINEVNLRRARLVLRWVTVSGVQSPVPENLSQYITSHPGQLSLAIQPWVGIMSTSQRAVMPCGWGVKAGMVREWVAGKTVWSPCYQGPYLSDLAMGSSHNRAVYKCLINYFTILYYALSLTTAFCPNTGLHFPLWSMCFNCALQYFNNHPVFLRGFTRKSGEVPPPVHTLRCSLSSDILFTWPYHFSNIISVHGNIPVTPSSGTVQY